MIEFENEKNNAEVLHKIKAKIRNYNLEDLLEKADKELFNMSEVVRILYFATITGQNAIIHGPGGYGKTKVIKWFYNQIGIPVYTMVCNYATTVEDLLGIPDMDKLLNNSEYAIAFEKTIFNNKGILFLEEGLDMQPDVAAALKDILTTKGYYRGKKIIPSFISSVIIATNKYPEEFIIDDSTAAFYKERFPHVIKLMWPSHTFKDYYTFISKKIDTSLDENTLRLLASVFEDSKLSPRQAIYNIRVIEEVGIKAITGLSTLNITSIDDMVSRAEEKISIYNFTETFDSIKKIMNTTKNYKDLFRFIRFLESKECPEDLITIRDSWLKEAKHAYATTY